MTVPMLHTTTPLRRTCALLAGVALLAGLGCGPAGDLPPTFHPATPQQAAALSYYRAAVKPIFKANCYRCHFGLNRKGGFNLGTRAQVLTGGHHGVAVVPGQPDSSLLMVVLLHQGPAEHPMPMPQKGEKLPAEELAAITKWIADGAIMDH